jgi:hypothetical protein
MPLAFVNLTESLTESSGIPQGFLSFLLLRFTRSPTPPQMLIGNNPGRLPP